MGTYNWDTVVEIEYPEAFQSALLKVLDVNKMFNYVYLGGAFTEPDQEKVLWFFSKGRRVRVRSPSFIYSALAHSPCDMLTAFRDLLKHNSWSLGSGTRM